MDNRKKDERKYCISIPVLVYVVTCRRSRGVWPQSSLVWWCPLHCPAGTAPSDDVIDHTHANEEEGEWEEKQTHHQHYCLVFIMLFTMELIMKLWLINFETWLYNNTGKGSKLTQSFYDFWDIKSDTCSVHSQPCVSDEHWTFYGNVGTSIQVLVDICVLSTHSLVSILAGYMKGGLSHGILYIHVSHMLHQVMKQLSPPVQSTSGSRGGEGGEEEDEEEGCSKA